MTILINCGIKRHFFLNKIKGGDFSPVSTHHAPQKSKASNKGISFFLENKYKTKEQNNTHERKIRTKGNIQE